MNAENLIKGNPYIYEREPGVWIEVLYMGCTRSAHDGTSLYLFKMRPYKGRYVNLEVNNLTKIKEISSRI